MNRNPMKISAILEVVSPQARAFSGRSVVASRPTTLKAVNGKTLVCVEGSLWITQEGDMVDHILFAGEGFNLKGRGAVVISSFSQGSYVLD